MHEYKKERPRQKAVSRWQIYFSNSDTILVGNSLQTQWQYSRWYHHFKESGSFLVGNSFKDSDSNSNGIMTQRLSGRIFAGTVTSKAPVFFSTKIKTKNSKQTRI